MHYSTPDGYYAQLRLKKIKTDHFLCHFCPMHAAENWRNRQKNKSQSKNKYKK